MEKTKLVSAVSDIVGFSVSQTTTDAKEIASEIADAIEQKIATPPTYEQTVHSVSDALRDIAPNENAKELIDAVEDLLIHEPGENWSDDIFAGFSALKNGVKAMKEKRRSDG